MNKSPPTVENRSQTPEQHQNTEPPRVTTNEDLAALIQRGHNSYLLQLWEQVRAFIHQKAVTTLRHIPAEHGVTVEDLEQSGYIALVSAVETFSPEKGTFLCWLEHYLKTEFAVAGGYRTSRRDPLNLSTSLDLPMSQTNEDAEPFINFLLDDSDPYAAVEECIYQEQLHDALENAIDTLPSSQADVLRGRYWQEKGLRTIAEELGISTESVRRRENTALSALRKSSAATSLSEFLEDRTDYYHCSGLRRFKERGSSSVEHTIIKREALEKRWHEINANTKPGVG